MTTRIRETNTLEYAKAMVSIVDYRGSISNGYYTGGDRCVRGTYKKTVDDTFEVPSGQKPKRLSLYQFPKYMHPWLTRGLLPPRPFEVSDVVGPENTNCELEYIGRGNYPSYYWGGELSTLSTPILFAKMFPVSSLVLDSRFTDYTYLGAYKNISAAQVDIGVSLGELLETVKFLANPLKGLVKLSKKLGLADLILHEISVNGHRYFKPGIATMTRRSRNIVKSSLKTVRDRYTKQAHRVIDDGSSLWCAYRFGVLPLLSDIGNYISLSADGLKTQQGPVYHGRGKFERFVSTTTEVHSFDGYSLARDAASTFTEQDTYRTDVQFLRNKFDMLTDLQAYGLHPSQWVNIAWELTQLSFVLDRFVNIGQWLEAKRPKPGTKVLGATHSLKRKRKLVMAVRRLFMGAQWPTYYTSTKWRAEPLTWESTLYRRTIANAVPVFPVLNPTLLDISQHVDHLSLLWQRLPRIKK